jgi:signal transduction histidine kinase
MAERMRSVGGALSVQSEVNRGTRIEASIPLPAQAQANSKTFTMTGRSEHDSRVSASAND